MRDWLKYMYISQRFIAEMNTGGSKTTRGFIPYTNYDFNVRTLINKDLFSKTYAKYINCISRSKLAQSLTWFSDATRVTYYQWAWEQTKSWIQTQRNTINIQAEQNNTFFTSDALMLNTKI